MYRVYEFNLILNDIHFTEIWIDPHYEARHSESISDDLILDLLTKLNRGSIEHQAESNGFRYYRTDLEHKKKLYRMVLVIPLDNSYLGVRNAFRRSK